MSSGGTISRALPRLAMSVAVVVLSWIALTGAGTGNAGTTASVAGGSYGWILVVLAGTFALLGVLFVGVASRR